MNKFKFYFILLITSITIFSCSKNNNEETVVEPLRDYQTQYNTDIADIEEYLKTNYITVTNAPGQTSDQDVVISKITDATTQVSIMSYTSNAYVGSTVFPQLWNRIVKQNDIEYKLYYLVLREGMGEFPCNSDNILIAYKGDYLSRQTVSDVTTLSTTFFEEIKFPQGMLDLSGIDLMASGGDLIKGWKEIIPQFKTGTYTSNSDGTLSHKDFGAGVMFIPSGLGYYTSYRSIPAYTPLIFSFKLYEIQRLDHDGDGIPDFQEDLDGDRYMPYISELKKGIAIADDTDSDGIPDFYDVDDDGDKYTTKLEIKNPTTGLPYPFANIPNCGSGTGKKIHLEPTCHP